jgi:hypothetical protein
MPDVVVVMEQEPLYGAVPRRRYCIREGFAPHLVRFEVLYEARYSLGLNAKLKDITERRGTTMGPDGHLGPWLIFEIEATRERMGEVREVLRNRHCEYAVVDPILLASRPRTLAPQPAEEEGE